MAAKIKTKQNKAVAKKGFEKSLEAWYKKNARDLPWRNTSNPYHIWLSEIMLQQTQVATVIPYYHRFIEKFPTISDLASAHTDTVLKMWEGLGYYARGRNLHKAACQIVEVHGGEFPDDIEDVKALSGIGESTAGAILTFSFHQKHPLLDGNVKRVLSRLYDIEEEINSTEIQKKLWQYSSNLLSQSKDPWTFNQAIMELGATLCMPKQPQCLICPVQQFCDAVKTGTQHERPVKVKKKPTPHYDIAVGVIYKGDKVLIQQRPNEGLLGGLWEFPGGKQEKGEILEETVTREIDEELGIQIVVQKKIATVKHAYTHFKITLHAYKCQFKSGKPKPTSAQNWCWTSIEKLSDYAFPKANKTVLELLQKEESLVAG